MARARSPGRGSPGRNGPGRARSRGRTPERGCRDSWSAARTAPPEPASARAPPGIRHRAGAARDADRRTRSRRAKARTGLRRRRPCGPRPCRTGRTVPPEEPLAHAGSKPLTSAATWQANGDGSKRVILPTPRAPSPEAAPGTAFRTDPDRRHGTETGDGDPASHPGACFTRLERGRPCPHRASGRAPAAPTILRYRTCARRKWRARQRRGNRDPGPRPAAPWYQLLRRESQPCCHDLPEPSATPWSPLTLPAAQDQDQLVPPNANELDIATRSGAASLVRHVVQVARGSGVV